MATVSRAASIDLGTNTFLLLVAEVTNGRIEPLVEREEIVRLGQGVDAAGTLSAEAIARGLACLQEYVAQARAAGAVKIYASGTSALRDAQNRQLFCEAARTVCGVEVDIISGADEARLTFFGALSNAPETAGEIAMLDIGGGSTEVVVGRPGNMEAVRSIDIGSVRLTERLLHSDPLAAAEIDTARATVLAAVREFSPLLKPRRSPTFIGVAGTIATLAAIAQKLPAFDLEKIDRYWLHQSKVAELLAMLARLPLAERRQIPGLRPERADVIVAGALILETFMAEFGVSRLLVSQRGLRYGFLLQKTLNADSSAPLPTANKEAERGRGPQPNTES